MARIKKNNKDVFQSYILTVAKYDFSIYEKKNPISPYRNGTERRTSTITRTLVQSRALGLRSQCNNASSGHTQRRDGQKLQESHCSLQGAGRKGIEYEDENTWLYTSVIEHPEIEKGTGIATFHVYDPVWKCILDFGKGFRKYELVTAMSFKSVYSMRMYELMSGQKDPISYTRRLA